MKKMIAWTLASVMLLSGGTFVQAEETLPEGTSPETVQETTTVDEKVVLETEDPAPEDTATDETPGKTKSKGQGKKALKETYAVEQAALAQAKEDAEAMKEEIEKQYEEAVASGDLALAETLKKELDAAKAAFFEAKVQYKTFVNEKKEEIKAAYSQKDLEDIQDAEKNILAKDKTAKVLPFNNIFSNTADFKMDTPPVIKSNRILVPVRAITEGFGAELAWDPATQKVTITKGDIEIVLILGTDKALVNGKEVTLDVTSELLNKRTYVPLRFILQTFNLKVNWDADTNTVEIIDETPDTAPVEEVASEETSADPTTPTDETTGTEEVLAEVTP